MTQFKLTVRTYKQEDLPLLIRLCNRTLAGLPHFIRDENFLRHFMHYPGVDGHSIFVALMGDQVTGLAILSITTEGGLRQGKIIELQAKDASSIRALIQATLNYCNDKDVDTIVVVPPPLQHANEVFEGWLKSETGVMLVKTLSPSSVLQALLSNEKVKDFFVGKKIVFHIGEEIIDVGNSDSEPCEAAIEVFMSPQTLPGIIFGHVNPYLAFLTRRIRVQGLRNIFSVLKLLCMMKLPTPLYLSLADRK